jgi:hypothetical protein
MIANRGQPLWRRVRVLHLQKMAGEDPLRVFIGKIRHFAAEGREASTRAQRAGPIVLTRKVGQLERIV